MAGARDRDLVQAVRAELAAIDPPRACCRAAERAGLGAAARGRARSPVVARLAVRLAEPLPGAEVEGRGTEAHGGFDWGMARSHCRTAWLRGRFLAAGSLSLGPRGGHLEIVVRQDEADELADRLEEAGFPAGRRERRGRAVLTWKRTETILAFLRSCGARASVLEVESRLVMRQLHGHLNRVLNAESANLERTVASSARQLIIIERSRQTAGSPSWRPSTEPSRASAAQRPRPASASLPCGSGSAGLVCSAPSSASRQRPPRALLATYDGLHATRHHRRQLEDEHLPRGRRTAGPRHRRCHRGARRHPRHLPTVRHTRGRARRAGRDLGRGGRPERPRRAQRCLHRGVSAAMLAGLATWSIVGHSERRRDQHETDELIGRKLVRLVEAGIRPILCVGELLDEREAGRAVETVQASSGPRSGSCSRRARHPGGPRHRLRAGLGHRHRSDRQRRGRRGDGDAIRATLAGLASRAHAEATPVLYGGSVTSAAIGEFLDEAAIDGALVGGASLKVDEMAGIVARAALTAGRAAWPRPGHYALILRCAPPSAGRPEGDHLTTRTERPCPLVLVVIDGFGIGPDPAVDAIAAADMPRWRGLLAEWPHCRLDASGPAVGLPAGQMGNSEVGHLNLGAGRPVLQDLPRIDAADRRRLVRAEPGAPGAPATRRGGRRRLHLLGLIGPGGVHANDGHLVAIVALAHELGVAGRGRPRLLDGRDTPPRSAAGFLPDLEARLGGRASGGPHRHDRRALLRHGPRPPLGADAGLVRGHRPRPRLRDRPAADASAALAAAYARGENDEFVKPTVIAGVDGRVRDGDVVIHFNFRADRARQLTHALVDDDFDGFDRGAGAPRPDVVTLTEYESGLPVEVAFPPLVVTSLAEVVSGLGWRQFHVAETEKYAHVTYFFNGGVEEAWPGEERRLVPSPKVATYDLQPEMSAAGVTDELVEAIAAASYDFIVANFANPDMVGHTGVWDATVDGLHVPRRLPRPGRRRRPGADAASVGRRRPRRPAGHHRRPRQRRRHADAAGEPVTKHSLSPVPFLLAGSAVQGTPRSRDGVLADVAPTLLAPGRASRPPPGMTRPLAARRRLTAWLSFAPLHRTIRSRSHVELILFLALVIIAVGLIASILLQSRGAGLGATFGGETARRTAAGAASRRGSSSSRSCWRVALRRRQHARLHRLAVAPRSGPSARGRGRRAAVLPSALARTSDAID